MTDLCKDSKGQTSSARIMSFLALLTAMGLSIAGMATGTPVNSDIVMWFLIGAFGGKVGSKFAEKGQ